MINWGLLIGLTIFSLVLAAITELIESLIKGDMGMIGFYIFTKLSDIVLGCIITGVVSIFGCLIATVAYYSDISTYDTKEEKEEILKHYHVKGLYFVCIIAWSLAILLPTTKQAAFIWVAPQIVENGAVKDTVKNIPELTKLGTEYLKELLNEKIKD